MKLIKINTNHYVVVDDSEITTGDIVAEKLLTDKYELFTIHTLNDIDKQTQKKITHSTQPLDKSLFFTDRIWGCERLSLGEVKELIGEVDVDKKVEEVYPQTYYSGIHIDGFLKAGYVKGYNQALEDNKEKKYTEEDVIFIVKKSRETGLTAEYLMLTLQPKTEWEVEIVDGKLKLR